MFKEKDFLKAIFFSRIFLAALVILTFWVAVSTGRAVWRKYQIEREISVLKKNISEIEKKNEELLARLDYFKSEENLEKEARAQLNVKRPGEKVVVIVGKENSGPAREAEGDSGANDSADENNLPNPLKWWMYFFAQNSSSL